MHDWLLIILGVMEQNLLIEPLNPDINNFPQKVLHCLLLQLIFLTCHRWILTC